MSALGVPQVSLGGTLTAPALAFGTGTQWFSRRSELRADQTLAPTLATAINLGFRHIDCAEYYQNEELCGLGIRQSNVPRDQLFITSKIYASLEKPEEGLKASLEKLGLSYLDLYLVHAPFKFSSVAEMQETWARLEACVEKGYIRSLGVSNFGPPELESLLKCAKVKPVVNQIEFHPYLQSQDLCLICKEHDIRIASYGTLVPILSASGGPLDPVLEEISRRLKKTKAQILIRWALQKGCIVVTTTSREDRMKDYLGMAAFALDAEDIDAIDEAGKKKEFRKYWVNDYMAKEPVG